MEKIVHFFGTNIVGSVLEICMLGLIPHYGIVVFPISLDVAI